MTHTPEPIPGMTHVPGHGYITAISETYAYGLGYCVGLDTHNLRALDFESDRVVDQLVYYLKQIAQHDYAGAGRIAEKALNEMPDRYRDEYL